MDERKFIMFWIGHKVIYKGKQYFIHDLDSRDKILKIGYELDFNPFWVDMEEVINYD